MRIVVTGGAGFIGSNLVEELVRRGRNVTVIDNFSTGSMENLKSVRGKMKVIRASCSKLPKLRLPRTELVFHVGIPSSSPMYRENPLLVGEAINDFINVLEFAKKNHSKIVYASTSSMYCRCPPPHREDMVSEPFDYYTEARIAMERLARVYHELYDISLVGLRFFSVYGPHEESKGRYANVITQMLLSEKEFTIYGDGSQTRDFVYVDDVVRAIILAAEKGEGHLILNVGTGRETSFSEVASLIQKIKPLEIKYAPNPIKNYVERTKADISLTRRKLNWTPVVKLEEGIKKTAEYYGI